MVRVLALASGAGTLFEALVAAAGDPGHPAEVVGLISDKPGSGATDRARRAGVPVAEVDPAAYPERAQWDEALTQESQRFAPDWIVSVGFMRLLGPAFLAAFEGRIVNSHPSLLPAFPGTRAVSDALAYGVRVTGCTVHLVDAGVDTGPILAQRPVDVADDDTVATLHERIKTVERKLIVEVVARLATRGYTLSGRKAVLS